MNDLAVIFQTEFMRRVRSRPFIIGTVIGAFGLILFAVLPSLLDHAFGSSSKKIVLAGPASITAPAKSLLSKDYDVVATLPDVPATPTIDLLNEHEKASALVVLGGGAAGVRVHVFARDAGGLRSSLADDLVPLNITLATHVPQAQVDKLLVVPVETTIFDTKFSDKSAASAARGVAYGMVFLLYLAIVLNAQNIMSSVAEEKTSRIAELLVASVEPTILLSGKILALGATGALQIAIWFAAGAAAGPLLGVGRANANSGFEGGAMMFNFASALPSATIAAFIIFFTVGLAQYALLYAAAASLISRTEDLSSVTIPLILPVVGGFLVAQFAILAPNAANVVALSQIPLLAPFVMFTRIAVATVPFWQIALSVVINIVALAGIAWGAGKVYRVGLLTYGRPPKLAQVWAVLRS